MVWSLKIRPFERVVPGQSLTKKDAVARWGETDSASFPSKI